MKWTEAKLTSSANTVAVCSKMLVGKMGCELALIITEKHSCQDIKKSHGEIVKSVNILHRHLKLAKKRFPDMISFVKQNVMLAEEALEQADVILDAAKVICNEWRKL